MALIIAAALRVATAVVSFVLPGRAPSPAGALTVDEEDLEVLMKDEAELAGTSLVAGEEAPPPGPKEDRP